MAWRGTCGEEPLPLGFTQPPRLLSYGFTVPYVRGSVRFNSKVRYIGPFAVWGRWAAGCTQPWLRRRAARKPSGERAPPRPRPAAAVVRPARRGGRLRGRCTLEIPPARRLRVGRGDYRDDTTPTGRRSHCGVAGRGQSQKLLALSSAQPRGKHTPHHTPHRSTLPTHRIRAPAPPASRQVRLRRGCADTLHAATIQYTRLTYRETELTQAEALTQ